jgi:hypothetical protein
MERLGARNMAESSLFKAAEAFECARVNDGIRRRVLFQKSEQYRSPEIRMTAIRTPSANDNDLFVIGGERVR